MIPRLLACFLSFSLLISSFPQAGWAQVRNLPQTFIPPPGPSSFSVVMQYSSSPLDFYRWIFSLPEFSRNPAGAAQILMEALPLFQRGAVQVQRDGREDRILLVSVSPDGKEESFLWSLADQKPSQPAFQLAEELKNSRGKEEDILRRYYDESRAEDSKDGAVLVPAVSDQKRVSPSSQDVWASMKGLLQRELRLEVSEESLESWKKETAEILRSRPSLPLEKALAEAISKVHKLDREKRDRTALILSGNPILEFPEEAQDLVQFKGKLYLAAEGGIYSKENGRWTEELDGGYKLIPCADDIYVSFLGAVYAKRGKKWVPALPRRVDYIVEWGGKVYAGDLDDKRVTFVKQGREFKPVNERPDLNVLEDFRRRYYPPNPIVEHQGKSYLGTSEGLAVWENKKWKTVVGGNLETNFLADIDGKLYLGTRSGLFSWMLDEQYLPKGWKGIVLTEMAARIKALQSSSEKEVPAPGSALSADEKGNILGEDGRTIFSGVQRASAFLLGMLGAGALEGLSRLALSFGNLSLGFGERADIPEVWETIKRHIEEGLDLDLQEVSSEKWAEKTAGILEEEPDLPLEKALPEALAMAYPSFEKNLGAVESLLKKNLVVRELSDLGWIYQVAQIGGRTYAASSNGLWVREKNASWRKILAVSVYRIEKFKEDLYAATPKGIYVQKQDGSWEKTLDGEFYFVGILKGRLYAAGEDRLYVLKETRKGKQWKLKKFWSQPHVSARRYFSADGRLYMATKYSTLYYRHGPFKEFLIRLFYRDIRDLLFDFLFLDFDFMGGGWTLVQENLGEEVFHAAVFNGKLYASSSRGLYVFEFKKLGGWKLQKLHSGEFKKVFWVGELDGKLHIGTTYGLYAQEKDGWKQIFPKPEVVVQALKTGDAVYLGGGDGLYRWVNKELPPLPADWKEKIPRLPAKEEVPAPDSRDVWTILAQGIRENLGLEAQAGEKEQFKEETARILRNHPDWVLEKALASALAGIDALDLERQKTAEAVLEGRAYRKIGQDIGDVHHVASIDGKLYAASDWGLYVLKGDHWEFMEKWLGQRSQRSAYFVAKINGKLYVGAEDGVYVQDEEGLWNKSLSARQVAYIAKFGPTLYAASRDGLHAYQYDQFLGGNRWTRDYDLSNKLSRARQESPAQVRDERVNHVARIYGKLFAATPAGLYVHEENGWVSALSAEMSYEDKNGKTVSFSIGNSLYGEIRHVAMIDGEMYVSAEKGLLIVEVFNGGRVSSQSIGSAYYVAKIKGKIYAAAEAGLYVREEKGWRLILKKPGILSFVSFDNKIHLAGSLSVLSLLTLPDLPSDWKSGVLKDVASRIETLQREDEKKKDVSSKPFSADGQGNIIGDDGRTLFGGGQGGSPP